jgi:hypothetical protein
VKLNLLRASGLAAEDETTADLPIDAGELPAAVPGAKSPGDASEHETSLPIVAAEEEKEKPDVADKPSQQKTPPIDPAVTSSESTFTVQTLLISQSHCRKRCHSQVSMKKC